MLLGENRIPVVARLGGVFAIDFVVNGVSKTTPVKYFIEHSSLLQSHGISCSEMANPRYLEVWGDSFSVVRCGADSDICVALPRQVRSICFRNEKSEEFLEGYNIVLWDGKKHLHEGLLEYLQSRA